MKPASTASHPETLLKSLKVGFVSGLCFAIWATPLMALAQYVPPSRGTPGRREGAGIRGGCIQGSKQLMPLVPENAFGTTTSHQPTLFWYVPPTMAKTAEFTLMDDRDTEVYKAEIPLPPTPGVVSYQLPGNISLQPDQEYRWQFSLICDPNFPSKNPFVEGNIQRVELNQTLSNQLEKAVLPDLPDLYASAGIWHDALSTLAELRCTSPGDTTLNVRWTRLLKSEFVSLGEFATEPLVNFCAHTASAP